MENYTKARRADTVVFGAGDLPLADMKPYRKKKITVRYVKTLDIFSEGTPVIIRAPGGDAEITASSGVYIMIGVVGELYPISSEKFGILYEPAGCGAETDAVCAPVVRNKLTGETVEIIRHASPCTAKPGALIMAMPLTKKAKVITKWNAQGFFDGEPGDYIAARADDPDDVYIIKADVFNKSYEPAQGCCLC